MRVKLVHVELRKSTDKDANISQIPEHSNSHFYSMTNTAKQCISQAVYIHFWLRLGALGDRIWDLCLCVSVLY